ncbi:MAG: calcium-translocating P-type ATPase, PMCA-type [Clostridia bacterium]|nr:calcium-translocating P-type ATPase, PMCA-type [Clostridia bacterium]
MKTAPRSISYHRISQPTSAEHSTSSSSPCPLSLREVEESRKQYGSNHLSVKPPKSFLKQFLSNLGDPIIRILLVALGLNLIFAFQGGTDWPETIGIALAVFLATLISTLSEYGSERAFARLSEECSKTSSRVMRRMGETGESVICQIPHGDVVVNDVVLLEAGEMIPADGELISGNLRVDQSAMTGESREIKKHPALLKDAPTPDHPAALFRGCTVLSGQGTMKVKTVGDKTFLGQISAEVQEDTRESPLKRRLSDLAKQISFLGYLAAGMVAVIYLINAFVFDSGFDAAVMLSKLTNWRYLWPQLFSALTLGLTVLVVAVPEGLPMMIAVVLSSNIKKMVKDKVLVRKPAGIEAAGSMNVLFTDKTGTLTEGKLSVGRVLLASGEVFETISDFKKKAPAAAEALILSAHLNSSATLGFIGDSATRGAIGGNATDRALLTYVQKEARPKHTEVMWKLPFDSNRKLSAVRVRTEQGERLYVKGAPERLVPCVTHSYDKEGRRMVVSQGELVEKIKDMTSAGERVLMVATATDGEGRLPSAAQAEQGLWGALTVICLVILKDKLRSEAYGSVQTLKRAGIHVVMMTGDNKDTARAIASSCGIIDGKVNRVLDSAELSRMSDDEIKNELPHIGVIARALPTDKSRLVRIAQEAELVVGMTGDGINDAPALKRADVGFAMGAGTQVAKDAGDIIIMDNNLSSITRAVLYGRTIFKSIRKFITLQLTMNFCAMAVTMICPFIGIDEPVTVVQMLWINLIMDTLGGLAFAGEAPLASYMEEPPKRRDEPILNGYMKHQILCLGGFTVALCLLFLKWPFISTSFRTGEDQIYLLTAFFALFIFSSVFNCFSCRTDRLRLGAGLAKNKTFCLVMTAVLVIQVLFVYVGGAVLRTAPLTPGELGLTCGLSLLVFPAELIRKLWWRLRGHKEGY